jgi:hypothetical protein
MENKMAKEKQNLQERMVKIIDAVVKEDEGTEEIPVVKKTLWLVLQDVETQAIFQSPLSLEDIKEITGMSRTLQGRELYNFATNLRARVEPIKLIVDLNQAEVSPEQIMKETI